jgi:hypothetical protein
VPDHEPDGRSFEDIARALADEVHEAVERLSTIDLDDIARAASRARAPLDRAFGAIAGADRRCRPQSR